MNLGMVLSVIVLVNIIVWLVRVVISLAKGYGTMDYKIRFYF